MKNKIFKIIAISLAIAMLFGMVAQASAHGSEIHFTHNNGKVDITTDEATISVTGGGNVPFYQIKLADNDSSNYQVKFSGLEEFVDKNNDGEFQNSESVPQSKLSFPGQDWTFSGFETINDTSNVVEKIDFNFTSSGTPMIELRNHIDVSNGNEIKFDIAIDNYDWTSTNNSAKLVIKMQITSGNLTKGSNSNDLTFGDAYFKSVSSAQTGDGDIDVSTQIENSNTFFLIYSHFNSSFIHDPTFGAVAGSNTNTTSRGPGISLEFLPILGGLTIISIIYTKKRKAEI
jgi:hypothetical protein